VIDKQIKAIVSSFLSELTFGNKDYTIAFICLSITLFLNQISAGQGVVLRGLSQLTYMAKSSLFGAISGLLISVPIYYLWGLEGIVPAIILSSIATLILTYYYSRKVSINTIEMSKAVFITESKDMIRMGLVLSLSSLVVLGESYIVRVFIRLTGSISDVGYYTAGFAIVNTYFGVIFTALTTDYYPRLASVAFDNKKANLLMNQQSEMTILILAPILVVFLVFINPIIILLYSKEFVPINDMILWAGLGIFFKAASWSLGVIFISRGNVKTLFISELSATLVMLVLNLLGYKYFGLEGLGLSFLGAFLFAYIQTFLIVRFKYSFIYSINFYKIFTIQLIIGTVGLIVVRCGNQIWYYLIGVVLIIISLLFSLFYLNRNTDILSIIKKKLKIKDENIKKH
jgi:O-antigen/teichoic acid export membrane protein